MLDINFNPNEFNLLEIFSRYCLIEKQRSNKTIADYSSILQTFCKVLDITTNEKLLNITNEQILKYLEYLSSCNYKAASKNQKIMCLKSFYHFLEDYEYISKNPFKRVKSFKDKELHTVSYLSEEEAKTFILHCKNIRDKAIFTTFLTVGLRLAELINIKMQDLVFTENESYLISCVKGGKMQKKFIPQATVRVIQEYITKFRNKQNCQYDNLFISNSGKPMNRVAITNTCKIIAKRAKINKNIHPHSFRHSFASIQLEKGASLKEVQMHLGHAQLSTTANIYTHIRDEKLNEGINKFNFNLE